jgi:hypothetical protein
VISQWCTASRSSTAESPPAAGGRRNGDRLPSVSGVAGKNSNGSIPVFGAAAGHPLHAEHARLLEYLDRLAQALDRLGPAPARGMDQVVQPTPSGSTRRLIVLYDLRYCSPIR